MFLLIKQEKTPFILRVIFSQAACFVLFFFLGAFNLQFF